VDSSASLTVSIVYNNVDGDINGGLGVLNNTAFVPVGGISRASGEALATSLRTGQSITATLDINILIEPRYSSNVIASSKAGNSSNVIFIGAHLDSVPAGPGINDNGSGKCSALDHY
jgi:Zn-dependent M28 family amino/carboxypeptidase